MKSRHAVLDHDLEYGRDIRIAGAVSLAATIAVFLFVPQPEVQPYQFKGVTEWVTIAPDTASLAVTPPEPPKPLPRGVPVAGDNPVAPTIGKNTNFTELKVVVTETGLDSVKFWKVERPPKLVQQVSPDYPEMARAAGIEGRVVVSMVIDTLGHVGRAGVYASSGNTLLDQAAVQAAYQCGFSPGYQRDRPVVVSEVIMTFNFKLQ